jgi:hypothetical protein
LSLISLVMAPIELRIDALDPAMPLALVGDQPIKVAGQGFHPGMTITMLFPGGGSGQLSGEQLRDLTPDAFSLIAAFNNNPGLYRIRINSPDAAPSEWFAFRVAPINLSPEIAEVKPGPLVNGVQRVTVHGHNFQQNLGFLLIRPDGRPDYPPHAPGVGHLGRPALRTSGGARPLPDPGPKSLRQKFQPCPLQHPDSLTN